MKMNNSSFFRIFPLIIGILALPLPLNAAVDMYIKIEGIKGESRDKQHKGEIDVLAWSWGMTQSGTSNTKPPPKDMPGELQLRVNMDKSSPLISACHSGASIP